MPLPPASRNGSAGQAAPSDEEDVRLEIAMGHLLRYGVSLAAIVVLIGGILYLRPPHGPLPDYRNFHGTEPGLRSVRSVLKQALHGSSLNMIQAGILLLIATPVARVVFALYGFLREKDWLYTAVSAAVLAILIFSMLHSR